MITSPSQVRTFAEHCKRRWGFGAIEQFYEPQTSRAQSQHDGDELHAHIENYVKYGIPFDETKPMAKLAALAKEHLPTIADDPLIENEELITYGPHQYRTKPDLMWLAPVGPIVLDHKSVEHYGFCLTPVKLRTDLQMVLYAYRAMKLYDEKSAIVQLIYYKRSPPIDYKVVETTIDWDDARRVLSAVTKIVDEMARLKEKKLPVLQLPPNRSSCGDYKKNCFYFDCRCFPGEPLPYPDKAPGGGVSAGAGAHV